MLYTEKSDYFVQVKIFADMIIFEQEWNMPNIGRLICIFKQRDLMFWVYSDSPEKDEHMARKSLSKMSSENIKKKNE